MPNTISLSLIPRTDPAGASCPLGRVTPDALTAAAVAPAPGGREAELAPDALARSLVDSMPARRSHTIPKADSMVITATMATHQLGASRERRGSTGAGGIALVAGVSSDRSKLPVIVISLAPSAGQTSPC
jgi:hypothetical protein